MREVTVADDECAHVTWNFNSFYSIPKWSVGPSWKVFMFIQYLLIQQKEIFHLGKSGDEGGGTRISSDTYGA